MNDFESTIASSYVTCKYIKKSNNLT